MKTHAIIPIFIPHEGCPHDCIFCNQNEITSRSAAPTIQAVDATVKQLLSTIKLNKNIKTVEIAFYGGSFTGIPLEKQSEYLSVALDYKRSGDIDKIHLSTRPDYIDKTILDNLKKYEVDVIELGVQSFDNEVLKLSNRGHDSDIVYKSSKLIKSYGFELGIQLMVGLPGDTREKSIFSAIETTKIAPSIARIYPTVILRNTGLEHLFNNGEYSAVSTEDAVETTKEMFKILTHAGINVIRVGLKSSDIINTSVGIAGGEYHPAFRQLVESAIAREEMEAKLKNLISTYKPLVENIRSAEKADTKLKFGYENVTPGNTGESGSSGESDDSADSAEYPRAGKAGSNGSGESGSSDESDDSADSAENPRVGKAGSDGSGESDDSADSAEYPRAGKAASDGSGESECIKKSFPYSRDVFVIFSSNPVSFSNMLGHRSSNKKYFIEKYSAFPIKYATDPLVAPGQYECRIEYFKNLQQNGHTRRKA